MPFPQKRAAERGNRLLRFELLIGVIAVFLMGSGCKVGPEFSRPMVGGIPEDFHQMAAAGYEPAIFRGHVDVAAWWGYFDDPILHHLIHEANAQNLGLQEAAWRIAESRARVGAAKSQFLPQINGSGGATYRNISENAGQNFASANSENGFTYFSNGLDSSWEIDLFGKLARGYESALAENLSQIEALHIAKVTLFADLASAYIQVRILQQRLRVTRENFTLQKQTLDIVQARQDAGLVGQLDQSEAESNLAVTMATVPLIEQELQSTLYRMEVLLGRVPNGSIALNRNAGVLPMAVLDRVEPGVPANLLNRRPDVRKAVYDVMSANALIGVAVADRLPQLTIRGDISLDSRNIDLLYSANSLVHSAGPSLRWNILQFGRLKRNIEARQAQHQQAVIRYQSTVLNAVQEVESALVEYFKQKERAEQLWKVTEATRRSVDISLIRYEQNLITFDRVLDAQRGLASAQNTIAQAEGDVLLALVRIFKALGGGWQMAM
jgi:outer membrane protein, multidrug efflux system